MWNNPSGGKHLCEKADLSVLLCCEEGVPHPAGKPSRGMRIDRRLRNRARYAHKSFSDCSSSGVSHPLRRLNDERHQLRYRT